MHKSYVNWWYRALSITTWWRHISLNRSLIQACIRILLSAIVVIGMLSYFAPVIGSFTVAALWYSYVVSIVGIVIWVRKSLHSIGAVVTSVEVYSDALTDLVLRLGATAVLLAVSVDLPRKFIAQPLATFVTIGLLLATVPFSYLSISHNHLWARPRIAELRHTLSDAFSPYAMLFAAALILAGASIFYLFSVNDADTAIFQAGFAALILGIIGMLSPKDSWTREIAPELISIFIAVIALDRMSEFRSVQQERSRVTHQLVSPSRDIALDALRVLKEQNWLYDGSLSGADLASASLSGADLSRANLHSTKLDNADLTQANMQGVNLRSASLKGADLSGSDLSNAVLDGANVEHARFVDANFTNASLKDIVSSDETEWPAKAQDTRSGDVYTPMTNTSVSPLPTPDLAPTPDLSHAFPGFLSWPVKPTIVTPIPTQVISAD